MIFIRPTFLNFQFMKRIKFKNTNTTYQFEFCVYTCKYKIVFKFWNDPHLSKHNNFYELYLHSN